MSDPIEFRYAVTDDIPALLEFWQLAGENDGRPADDASKVEHLIERDGAATLVAVRGGEIVGTLISGWDGWRAHLYRLAVHPAARRQGIAAQLLARSTQRLGSLGATRLDAMVLEENDLGRALWKAEGYEPQEEWRRWVRPLP